MIKGSLSVLCIVSEMIFYVQREAVSSVLFIQNHMFANYLFCEILFPCTVTDILG